jgi:anti-sigma regulatory factor (Ser/Thr protein kinase)
MQTERLAVLAADWFPGHAAAVGHAREFVRGVLGDAWPRLDDLLLMVSEVASNAVRHTASGDPGGWLDLTISAAGSAVRVAIADGGGSSEPQIPDGGGEPDVLTGGRGLRIVDALADRWGHTGDELGRVVWFEVECQ